MGLAIRRLTIEFDERLDLAGYLRLPGGTPAGYTETRVGRRVDPDAPQAALAARVITTGLGRTMRYGARPGRRLLSNRGAVRFA